MNVMELINKCIVQHYMGLIIYVFLIMSKNPKSIDKDISHKEELKQKKIVSYFIPEFASYGLISTYSSNTDTCMSIYDNIIIDLFKS